LLQSDSGGGAGLAHGLMQRFAGLRFTGAEDVARASGRRGQALGVVTHGAEGFGTAAVDAEEVGHASIFITGGWGSGSRLLDFWLRLCEVGS
jgi:hypothetical protein